MRFAYLFLDATYVKCRVGGRVRSEAFLTAIAVGDDGRKHFVGFTCANAESYASWRGFLQDLEEHDVFAKYRAGAAKLRMVHGGKDDVAPPDAAQAFARQFGAEIVTLPNGEHNLMGEGELDRVLDLTRDFFLEK